MPYILKDRRKEINPLLVELIKEVQKDETTAGDLNYAISQIIWNAYDAKPGYARANSLMGVLQGVQAEFYRRKVAPYEDEKIDENGDIQCVF